MTTLPSTPLPTVTLSVAQIVPLLPLMLTKSPVSPARVISLFRATLYSLPPSLFRPSVTVILSLSVTVLCLPASAGGSAAIAGAMLAQVITPVAISIANSFLVEQLLVPWLFAISETTTYALRASLQITLNTLFMKTLLLTYSKI